MSNFSVLILLYLARIFHNRNKLPLFFINFSIFVLTDGIVKNKRKVKITEPRQNSILTANNLINFVAPIVHISHSNKKKVFIYQKRYIFTCNMYRFLEIYQHFRSIFISNNLGILTTLPTNIRKIMIFVFIEMFLLVLYTF